MRSKVAKGKGIKMLFLPLTMLQFMNTVAEEVRSKKVPTVNLSGRKFQACSFTSTTEYERINQTGPFEDEIYQIFNDAKHCNNVSAPLSEVAQCISSFELDLDNALQHLQATIDVLNDNYVFKDIAIDPLDSKPLKTPFDDLIYNGTDQGQFDIMRALADIELEITSSKRATLGMILDMNSAAAKLFDAHFLMNHNIASGGILSNRTLTFFSEEVLNGTARATSLRTVFPSEDERFVLIADINHTDTSVESRASKDVDESNGFFDLFTGKKGSSESKGKGNKIQDPRQAQDFPTSAPSEFPTVGIEKIGVEEKITVISKEIKKIDGKDPLDFFVEFASQPIGLTNYKSPGVRAQSMIQYFTNSIDHDSGCFLQLKLREHHPDISKYIKDEYEILYADGSTTKWKVEQFVPQPVSCDMTRENIGSLLLEQPGKMFEHLGSMKRAVKESEKILKLQKKDNIELKKKLEEGKVKMLATTERSVESPKPNPNEFKFSMINVSESIGYSVLDDYAVLKIDTFSSGDKKLKVIYMLQAWESLTKLAHKKGVKKLIIDIIGNGGGVVVFGYFLVQLLYPTATWEDLSNPYDRLFSKTMEGRVADIQEVISQDVTDLMYGTKNLQPITDELNANPNLLLKKFDSILSLFEAISHILSGDKFKTGFREKDAFYLEGSILAGIQATRKLRASAESRINSSEQALTSTEVQNLWHIYLSVANNIFKFPFEDMDFKNMFGIGAASLLSETRNVEHKRGGVLGNYTTPFWLLNPSSFVVNKDILDQFNKNPHQFNEYILLSSGAGCGSTTSTVQHTMETYAHTYKGKKVNGKKVPTLRTVGFGGTGSKQDTAITQFPAGVAGEAGNVESMYTIALILRIINTLIPSADSTRLNAFKKFYNDLPDPCYYCNEAFTMSKYEIYSKLTGTDSIPLEFVNRIPDHYIKQWPGKTSFKHPEDLPKLYKMASAFFDEKEKVVIDLTNDKKPLN